MRNVYLFGVLAVFVLALAAAGCQKKVEEPATGEETALTAATEEEPEMPLALSEEADKLAAGTKVAVMELEAGLVEIELFTDETPATAGNFVALCEDNFYDGIIFHRVEPGFVVQAGDATLVGRANPALALEVEPDKRKCLRGAISMARGFDQATGEYLDTSPTQFFILLGDSPHLDPDFCVFGVVVTGMDIVDGIKQNDVIKRFRVLTVGEEEGPTE
ncbi:MAG: peptidylprolyl isomerase [Candidatus Coatesbacteria bacterium]|nr:MAG: peptidylprolyl isomerase [Candidatus Coatesbacteria bacterium]